MVFLEEAQSLCVASTLHIRSILRLPQDPESDQLLCFLCHVGRRLTPITKPICTSPGIFLALPDSSFPALRPHSMRAFSSVAMSSALKGIRFAFKMVSIREVAVTMCDDPDVSDV
jgi:hypothetical protein